MQPFCSRYRWCQKIIVIFLGKELIRPKKNRHRKNGLGIVKCSFYLRRGNFIACRDFQGIIFAIQYRRRGSLLRIHIFNCRLMMSLRTLYVSCITKKIPRA